MSILVSLEGQVRSNQMEDTKAFISQVFPDPLLSYNGCQRVDVYFNKDNQGNMVVMERWKPHNHYENYHEWCVENGVPAKAVSMLDGSLSTRYFERDDI